MAKIIDSLVEYMLAARRAKLPEEVIQKGKSHLLDTLAAIVSGSTLKPGELGLQHARQQGGREECSVLGSSLKTTPILAAFANGMSGTMACSLVTAVSYRLAAFGTKGTAELLTPELDFRFSAAPAAMPTGRQAAAIPEVIENRGFNGLLAELEAFAGAIKGGPAYPIPVDQIVHGVAVFEAIVRSAAERRPVKVARD